MWVCIFGKTHKDKCDETRGYIERVLHVKVRRQEIDGVVTMFYARFSNYLGVHVKPGPLTGTLPGVIGSTIRFEDYNQVFLFSKYTDFTITSQPYICAKFVYINELYIKNMLKPPNINAKKYNNSTRNKAIIIRGKPKKHIKYKMM